jgi:hypothetical protein
LFSHDHSSQSLSCVLFSESTQVFLAKGDDGQLPSIAFSNSTGQVFRLEFVEGDDKKHRVQYTRQELRAFLVKVMSSKGLTMMNVGRSHFRFTAAEQEAADKAVKTKAAEKLEDEARARAKAIAQVTVIQRQEARRAAASSSAPAPTQDVGSTQEDKDKGKRNNPSVMTA